MQLKVKFLEPLREMVFDTIGEFGLWLYSFAVDHGSDVSMFVAYDDDGVLDIEYAIEQLKKNGVVVVYQPFEDYKALFDDKKEDDAE